MYSEAWQTVRSIVLMHWGELESVSQTYPAINVLHQALPNVRLTLLTPYSSAQLKLQNKSVHVVSFQDWNLNLTISAESNISDLKIIQQSAKSFIQTLRHQSFDASIIFTNLTQSPYVLAYFCYLAGIPIRLGQSHEFGGGVLSICIKPSAEHVSTIHHHLHLLKEAGFSTANATELAIA